jgi:hypothetical protein
MINRRNFREVFYCEPPQSGVFLKIEPGGD